MFAYDPDGSESDGIKRLRGTLIDLAGNTAAVDGAGFPTVEPLYVDYPPPLVANAILQRAPFFAPADPGDGTVRFSTTDGLTGQAVSGSLLVVATEAVAEGPLLQVVGPDALSTTLQGVRNTVAEWDVDSVPDTEGAYTFQVVLSDDLGNTSDPQTLPVSMIVDLTPPTDAPDVATPGRIVYTRGPNGSVGVTTSPVFTLEGAAGAALSGATVVVRNGTGGIVTSTVAGSDGAFGPLSLPGDVSGISVGLLDDAGNAGPSAPVPEGRFVANLQGKTLGNRSVNANVFREIRHLSGVGIDLEMLAESVPSAQDDNPDHAGAERVTRGGPVWYDVSQPEPTLDTWTSGHIATNHVRGEVVLFGGGVETFGLSFPEDYDDTWRFDGLDWHQLDVARHPSARVGVAMAHDPARGGILMHGGLSHLDIVGLITETHDDTWWLDVGTNARPAHLFDVDVTNRLDGDVALDRVEIRWTVEAVGFPGGFGFAGVELLMWDGIQWVSLATFDGGFAIDGLTAPTERCVVLTRDDSGTVPSGCLRVIDPGLITAPFVGTDRTTLPLAARSLYASGTGNTLYPNLGDYEPYGLIETRQVEVSLSYRLDAAD